MKKIFPAVFCVVLILALVISIAILAAVPPTDRDSLTHHLYIPKLYLKHGSIYEIPSIEFSYFPMNLEMLYMIPLYFGNDIAPKYLHFTFAILTACLIFKYLKRCLCTLYALYGMLLFLSIPIILKLSISAYVDLGLIFFSFLSMYYLLKWAENILKFKYLVISAIGCGLGLGTKYNGMITFFLLTMMVPFCYTRQLSSTKNSFLRPAGYAAMYLLISMIVFSPWMIRDMIWKHNPVYPLYDSWFNPEKQKLDPDGVDDNAMQSPPPMNHFLIRKYVFHEYWWQTVLIPIRIFFEGQDDNPGKFDGRLNPLIFLLPFFAFIRKRDIVASYNFDNWAFLSFSSLFVLYAFVMTDMRIRYIAPAIPHLVILSIIGLNRVLSWIPESVSKRWQTGMRAGIWSVVLALFGLSAAYLVEQFEIVQPLSYIMGTIGRDDYITKILPEYPAVKFANQYLPNSAKILAVFLGNRGYYLDRDVRFVIKLPISSSESSSAEIISSYMHRKGFTHLLIRYDLFDQWYNSLSNSWQKEATLRFFQMQTQLVFSSGSYGLYVFNDPIMRASRFIN